MLVHVFLGLVAIQFFLAGLGAFHHNPKPSEKIVETSAFDPQRIGGDIISLVTILIVITAVVTRRQVQLSLALLVLMIVQNVLAGLGEKAAVFGALHALNGVAITAVAVIMMLGMRPGSARPAPTAR